MAGLILLAILASGNEPPILEANCQWIEDNAVINLSWCEEQGRVVASTTLVQIVFWKTEGRKECLGWRMADKVRFVSEKDGVSAVWHDGERLVRVRAKYLLRTATDWDVEVANRELIPVEQRRWTWMGDQRLYPSIKVMRAKEK